MGKDSKSAERKPASASAVRMGRFFVAAFREVQHDMREPARRQAAARRVARLYEQAMGEDLDAQAYEPPPPSEPEPPSEPPPSSEPGGGGL